MNIVSCVATFDGSHIIGFLNEYARCTRQDINHKLLILQTGLDQLVADTHSTVFPGHFIRKVIPSAPRMYASVMYEKIQFVKQFANEDTIFVNIDEDYSVNPNFLKFAYQIMSENPHVNYMSLLRGLGVVRDDNELEILSGFRFYRWDSCMGGSMICRWSAFQPLVDQFFTEKRVTGTNAGTGKMFDHYFWQFVISKTHDPQPVYTTFDFSLVQHCRLGSHYRDDKIGCKVRHLYAENYDSRLDPWRLRIQ